MRLATLAACADTFFALTADFISISRCIKQFSRRRAALALMRQPAANFYDPGTSLRIVQGIREYCQRKRLHLADLVGSIKIPSKNSAS